MHNNPPLLKIQDLHTQTAKKNILQGINLTVNPGEIHAIMGPNGSGKSSLAYTLTAHPEHKIVSGSIFFNNHDLQHLTPAECATLGLFLTMQHPITIPGVSTIQFLKAALNAKNKAQNLPALDTVDLLNQTKTLLQQLKITESMLERALNDGCSGGEKKLNELLQLLLLKPKLAILDEIDSGLDIDALIIAANAIKQFFAPTNAIILITHYQRILNYIQPNYIHILAQGKIVLSGDSQLALELEKYGYKKFIPHATK